MNQLYMKRIIFVSQCLMNRTLNENMENINLLNFFANTDIGIVQMPCPKFSSVDCKEESQKIVTQIQKYLKNKFNVLGIIGVESSPTCAVYKKKKGYGRGTLFNEIEREMQERKFQVPLIGIDSNNAFSSLRRLKLLVKNC